MSPPSTTIGTDLGRFVATGDGDAFASLVRTYQGLVYHACLRVLGEPALAEDAAQNTFVALANRAASIQENLPGWLHATATRMAINLLHQERSQRRRMTAAASDTAADVTEDAPESDDESRIALSRHVDACLLELDADDRWLLTEHFLLGRSQVAIAAASGTVQPAISRRLNRAVERLRTRLARRGVALTGIAPLAWLEAGAIPSGLSARLSRVTAAAAPAPAASAWLPFMIAGGIACAGGAIAVGFWSTAEDAPPPAAARIQEEGMTMAAHPAATAAAVAIAATSTDEMYSPWAESIYRSGRRVLSETGVPRIAIPGQRLVEIPLPGRWEIRAVAGDMRVMRINRPADGIHPDEECVVDVPKATRDRPVRFMLAFPPGSPVGKAAHLTIVPVGKPANNHVNSRIKILTDGVVDSKSFGVLFDPPTATWPWAGFDCRFRTLMVGRTSAGAPLIEYRLSQASDAAGPALGRINAGMVIGFSIDVFAPERLYIRISETMQTIWQPSPP